MTAPIITAHAVVRYLERALEFDIAALRAESGLPKDDDVSLVAWLSEVKKYPIVAIRRHLADYVAPVLGMGINRLPFDGVVLCIQRDSVVTVLTAAMKPYRTRRRHPRDFREAAE